MGHDPVTGDATFEIPVKAPGGELAFWFGNELAAADKGDTYGESGFGMAGRIGFVVDYRLDGHVSLEFDGFQSERDRKS